MSSEIVSKEIGKIDLKNQAFIDGKYLINEQTEIKSLDILFKKIN